MIFPSCWLISLFGSFPTLLNEQVFSSLNCYNILPTIVEFSSKNCIIVELPEHCKNRLDLLLRIKNSTGAAGKSITKDTTFHKSYTMDDKTEQEMNTPKRIRKRTAPFEAEETLPFQKPRQITRPRVSRKKVEKQEIIPKESEPSTSEGITGNESAISSPNEISKDTEALESDSSSKGEQESPIQVSKRTYKRQSRNRGPDDTYFSEYEKNCNRVVKKIKAWKPVHEVLKERVSDEVMAHTHRIRMQKKKEKKLDTEMLQCDPEKFRKTLSLLLKVADRDPKTRTIDHLYKAIHNKSNLSFRRMVNSFVQSCFGEVLCENSQSIKLSASHLPFLLNEENEDLSIEVYKSFVLDQSLPAEARLKIVKWLVEKEQGKKLERKELSQDHEWESLEINGEVMYIAIDGLGQGKTIGENGTMNDLNGTNSEKVFEAKILPALYSLKEIRFPSLELTAEMEEAMIAVKEKMKNEVQQYCEQQNCNKNITIFETVKMDLAGLSSKKIPFLANRCLNHSNNETKTFFFSRLVKSLKVIFEKKKRARPAKSGVREEKKDDASNPEKKKTVLSFGIERILEKEKSQEVGVEMEQDKVDVSPMKVQAAHQSVESVENDFFSPANTFSDWAQSTSETPIFSPSVKNRDVVRLSETATVLTLSTKQNDDLQNFLNRDMESATGRQQVIDLIIENDFCSEFEELQITTAAEKVHNNPESESLENNQLLHTTSEPLRSTEEQQDNEEATNPDQQEEDNFEMDESQMMSFLNSFFDETDVEMNDFTDIQLTAFTDQLGLETDDLLLTTLPVIENNSQKNNDAPITNIEPIAQENAIHYKNFPTAAEQNLEIVNSDQLEVEEIDALIDRIINDPKFSANDLPTVVQIDLQNIPTGAVDVPEPTTAPKSRKRRSDTLLKTSQPKKSHREYLDEYLESFTIPPKAPTVECDQFPPPDYYMREHMTTPTF